MGQKQQKSASILNGTANITDFECSFCPWPSGQFKPPLQLSRRFWSRIADCGVRHPSPTPCWSQQSPRRDRAEPRMMDFQDWSPIVWDCSERGDEHFRALYCPVADSRRSSMFWQDLECKNPAIFGLKMNNFRVLWSLL